MGGLIGATEILFAGSQLKITASIGASTLGPQKFEDAQEMFRVADEFLYRAKNEGRNKFIHSCVRDLTGRLKTALARRLDKARTKERERFTSRQSEISRLLSEESLAKLEREIELIEQELRQGVLFDRDARIEAIRRSKKEREEELIRRRTHLKELAEQLTFERKRVIDEVLPRRYALRGEAQCFPVAVEIWLP